MELARIRIADPDQEARGIYELVKRFRVICLADSTFFVPPKALERLDDLAVKYEVIERCSLDHAIKALRDSAAVAV